VSHVFLRALVVARRYTRCSEGRSVLFGELKRSSLVLQLEIKHDGLESYWLATQVKSLMQS